MREIVFPGQNLGVAQRKGEGTYIESGYVYSALIGIKVIMGDTISVIPFRGRYIPKVNDIVVGRVIEITQSLWVVDINSPYVGLLFIEETQWNVKYGETSNYLKKNDTIITKILTIDDNKKIALTMKDRELRKINEGTILEIEPMKIPRLVGKEGSMIILIKRYTNCRMAIGKNGWIWIDGNPKDIAIINKIIKMIETESHQYGLTDKITKVLIDIYGEKL